MWQRILATDWGAPATWALGMLSDRRVQQYWDPDNLVGKQMKADARAPQPTEDCCEQSGVLWDLAAVYERGASWSDRLPTATVFNGPVVDITSDIESALVALVQKSDR